MLHTFDLTGERFHHFDFREGIIAFNPRAACDHSLQEKTLVFMVQGAVLNQWAGIELLSESAFSLPDRILAKFPCPLYLAGWGKLVMERVRSVALHLAPIAPRPYGHEVGGLGKGRPSFFVCEGR